MTSDVWITRVGLPITLTTMVVATTALWVFML
jgi:hypothetical protein